MSNYTDISSVGKLFMMCSVQNITQFLASLYNELATVHARCVDCLTSCWVLVASGK